MIYNSLQGTLIPCFLTFCSTIEFDPYLTFKFLIFYHSSLFAMLSIHNNLSAGTQNVTGTYIIIMIVYRCLLTMCLHDKAAV